MGMRRISGPEPILAPGDIPGEHAEDDAGIAGIIAAVQAGIDGPTGWLGRSLGQQELELTAGGFCGSIWLPYEPVTEIVSVHYRDSAGVQQTLDPAHYRLAGGNRCQFGTGFTLPGTERSSDAVTITYKAGYAVNAVPANAKQAVIIGVQQLRAMGEQSLFLREEDVEGIGRTVFSVSEAATHAVKSATDMLLQPLRVYSL